MTILIGILIIIGLGGYSGWYTGMIHFGSPTIVHTQLITDFSNKQKLMGASHNVFIGKVLSKKTTINFLGTMPATVFEVEVLQNIKGNLGGRIEVLQEGGCLEGRCVIMSGDVSHEMNTPENMEGSLLAVGNTYILSTREDSQYGNIVIPHTQGKLPLSNTNFSKDTQFRAMKKAYIEEIPFEEDLKSGNDKNAFTKLNKEKQQVLRKEVSELN